MTASMVLGVLDREAGQLSLPPGVRLKVKRIGSAANGTLIVARLVPTEIEGRLPRTRDPVVLADFDVARSEREWVRLVEEARERLYALAREAWPKPYHLAFRPGRRRYPLRARCVA